MPCGYEDALKSPQAQEWLKAIEVEYNCLVKNGTWEVVERPANVPIVGCRWVFDLKFDTDGSIKRYKARLVAQGFSQTHGVDYFDTFAPVASAVSVRLLLALATIYNWDIRQLDIETAYLNAPVKETIYMRQVPGFEVPGNKVLKLKRSLYGLKQSGKNWNDYLSEFLLGIGMQRSKIDPCLFYFRDSDGTIALLSVYVDDLLITGDATKIIDQIVERLGDEFKVKELGGDGVYQLLGMVIERDMAFKRMRIHQGPYIRRMLKEFDIHGVRPYNSPTPEDMYAQVIEAAFDGDQRTIDFDYRGAIGCLLHLANCSRPDIANGVRLLSTYVSNYTDIHVKMVKRMLKYLELTADLGLFYDGECGADLNSSVSSFSSENMSELLSAYTDASWADNYDDGTSNSGLCIMLGDSLVMWRSVKQRIIASSTMESEYIAMSHCVDEIQYIRDLILEICRNGDEVIMECSNDDAVNNILTAVTLYGDNTASIVVGNASFHTKRSRHINVRFHNVKDAVRGNLISLEYIPSKKNKADFFTKCLGIPTFRYLRSLFMG